MLFIRYFSNLSNGKLTLWCYLIWYLNTLAHHFDPAPSIWLNSVGLSALIGVALMLSVGGHRGAGANRWQTFRLFAMPFAVSSFSSLIKGQGFVLIFSPSSRELAWALGLCAAFIVFVMALRHTHRVTHA
jgi:hypothetical protein